MKCLISVLVYVQKAKTLNMTGQMHVMTSQLHRLTSAVQASLAGGGAVSRSGAGQVGEPRREAPLSLDLDVSPNRDDVDLLLRPSCWKGVLKGPKKAAMAGALVCALDDEHPDFVLHKLARNATVEMVRSRTFMLRLWVEIGDFRWSST